MCDERNVFVFGVCLLLMFGKWMSMKLVIDGVIFSLIVINVCVSFFSYSELCVMVFLIKV